VCTKGLSSGGLEHVFGWLASFASAYISSSLLIFFNFNFEFSMSWDYLAPMFLQNGKSFSKQLLLVICDTIYA
jgi:hypothetical protein